MKKFLIVSIIFSLVLFMFTAVAFAHINITIDGTFKPGEWNRYHWFTDSSEGPGTGYDDDPLPIFSGYITYDSENLYLAFNVKDNTPDTNRDFLYVTIDMPPVGEFNDPIDALYWGSISGNPSFFGEAYLTGNAFPGDRSQRASTWGTDGGVLTARTITSTNRYYEIKIPLVAIGATIGDTIGLKIQARAGQYMDASDPQVVNFYPNMPDGITPIRSDTRVEVTGNFYHYTLAQDSHKVRNKWDLMGTFVSSRTWGSIVPVGSTWNYEVHIKEAMDGEKSVGVVKFMSGDVEVIGHVKATKTDYLYWKYPGDPYDTWNNLAAVGQAEYSGTKYNFMFLYSEGAIWIALSNEPYDTEWSGNIVWSGSLRAYDLLSQIILDEYPFDEKAIHE